ncbi:hypothetical protein GCM10007036_07250 [Alsobacter metallidurans]|uniref:Uncharacterized protein n=1 Tax=Alsobacter metallidurans TaxID=340221 RepID=A0A917MGE4_9HYPH|nr:hypothetical protein [Alsobacter metallidurans]GGH10610.1 hypothetical protein GCM10007036_07250 [Alsobacter metallidurans]
MTNSHTALTAFAEIVSRTGRITFGDVQRLHRKVLPDGVSSREEIEVLIRLERDVRRYDRAYGAWLVANVVDYAVWGERPIGVLTAEMSDWLAPLLDKSRPTLVRIAKEIAREAQDVGASIEDVAAGEDGTAEAFIPARVEAELTMVA